VSGARPRGALVARPLQPRGFRRDFGEIRPHQYLLTRRSSARGAAAEHRSLRREICANGRPEEPRARYASFVRATACLHGIPHAHAPAALAHSDPHLGQQGIRPASVEHVSRRQTAVGLTSPETTTEAVMLSNSRTRSLVNDQDEALEFYTEKLGMELARTSPSPSSGTSAGCRSRAGPGRPITLMEIPGRRCSTRKRGRRFRTLLAEGAAGGSSSRRTTKESKRGPEEPRRRVPAGADGAAVRIDAGFAIRPANNFRMMQRS